MLNYVQRLLRDELAILSTLHLDKDAGSSYVYKGRMIIKRKRTYILSIATRKDVERFAESVGFSIARKQGVLVDTLSYLSVLGSKNAATKWRLTYNKVGGRWKKGVDYDKPN